MMPATRVSSAEFLKNYGAITDKALTEPVTITRNGRDRLVVLSAAEFDRLKRRDRQVVLLENFSDEELELIARSEVPPGHDHLDAELTTKQK